MTLQAMRREIFEDNLALISAHNAEAANGLHTFEIGLNEFADMTDKEFFSTMNGYVMSEADSVASSGGLYEPRQVDGCDEIHDLKDCRTLCRDAL